MSKRFAYTGLIKLNADERLFFACPPAIKRYWLSQNAEERQEIYD